MLLSYFRKIDAYSGIRMFALAIAALALTGIDASLQWERLLLATVLGAAWLFLSWTVMRDRWVVRGTLFRYLIFLVLAVYWSGELYLTDLLFFTLFFELNWHLIELHRRKPNTLYVLHSGTLTAIAGLWSPDEAFSVIGPAVVLTWMVSGGIKFKTLLQWVLVFAVSAALVNGIGEVVWTLFLFFFFKQKTAYEISECDWSSDVCSSDLRCSGTGERTSARAPDGS